MADDQVTWRTGRVARELDVSPERVRQLADAGALACSRTADGLRLFRPDDVRELASRRAKRTDGGQP